MAPPLDATPEVGDPTPGLRDGSGPPPDAPGPASRPPGWRQVWRQPLPGLLDRPVTRITCRCVLTLLGRQLVGVEGLDHVHPANDPFILVLNHSQRPEAVLVPAWLCFFRRGRQVHFLSDWNFLMVPVVGQILLLNEPIIVSRKSARPRWLNRVKPLFTDVRPAMDRAADELRRLRSVGIFPEGTVNRHPHRMLRGLTGAARLSLETGVPVVPAGLRFPANPARPGASGAGDGWRPISDRNRFSLHIGAPLHPPTPTPGNLRVEEIEAWHATLMSGLSVLSGKSWTAQHPRTKNENQTASGRYPR